MIRSLALGALLAVATPALAQTSQQRAETALSPAATGTRFGLVVLDEGGREIVAISPDQRFIPASNTKIFTTAATYATLPDLDQPDTQGGARVRLSGKDVVLEGRGDARMSSEADCTSDCLATLADAVAAKTRRVRDVIGDDMLFPDQRWSPGMSWNNIPSGDGTAISALTLDNNEMLLEVTPGAVGKAPVVTIGQPYYTIDNRAVTVPGAESKIDYYRDPHGSILWITGTIGADAPKRSQRIGIDDPAHYAAWRLKALLEARGVRVTGKVAVRHRVYAEGEVFVRSFESAPLASLTPPPLADDIRDTMKVSQNLHTELFLRRLSAAEGNGSIAGGHAKVAAMLELAGVPRTAWDFSDGSGMSTYNRVAPRGTVKLLRWIAAQPWGAKWRESLPVGGQDGTLRNRFKGTILEGKVFAKTGTLNASDAVSGYLIAKSGKTLTFAAYANDIPRDAGARPFLDAALVAVAKAN